MRLVRPYLVMTSMLSSGTRCTIHSPCASSSKSFSRMSSVGALAGSRWKTRCGMVPRVIGVTGMETSPVILPPNRPQPVSISTAQSYRRSRDTKAFFFKSFFHHVLQDHMQSFVNFLNHVEHAGHMPDQVEFCQRLFVDDPGRFGGVMRFRWDSASPEVEIV